MIADTPWTPLIFADLKVGDILEWKSCSSASGVRSGVITRIIPADEYGPWLYFDGSTSPRDPRGWLNNPIVQVTRKFP